MLWVYLAHVGLQSKLYCPYELGFFIEASTQILAPNLNNEACTVLSNSLKAVQDLTTGCVGVFAHVVV